MYLPITDDKLHFLFLFYDISSILNVELPSRWKRRPMKRLYRLRKEGQDPFSRSWLDDSLVLQIEKRRTGSLLQVLKMPCARTQKLARLRKEGQVPFSRSCKFHAGRRKSSPDWEKKDRFPSPGLANAMRDDAKACQIEKRRTGSLLQFCDCVFVFVRVFVRVVVFFFLCVCVCAWEGRVCVFWSPRTCFPICVCVWMCLWLDSIGMNQEWWLFFEKEQECLDGLYQRY